MVRKDSGIQTVADLKGKVVAVNGLGSGVHMAMTAMLQKHGLQDKRDYIVIEAPLYVTEWSPPNASGRWPAA